MASTPWVPATIPPFDNVVLSPESGVEMSAQTPSATFSSAPNGSRATTAPGVARAQSNLAASGILAATKARCAAHEPDCVRNSRRVRVIELLETGDRQFCRPADAKAIST